MHGLDSSLWFKYYESDPLICEIIFLVKFIQLLYTYQENDRWYGMNILQCSILICIFGGG